MKKKSSQTIDVEETLRGFPAFVKDREKKMRMKIKQEKKYLNEVVEQIFGKKK
jgi:hypothetical protein